ncbi:hypothetical protein T459_08964 [Capsicum annuum]|uniref:Uncharacterized protein n=1 Tax=Capsicum annuum TaxID=4072 RepID=A0A2G2ZY21_CAPAN|nr:hypothetical protein T459_08964 [Capsicum annuum]
MESEFIVLNKAGEEAEWLRNFLEDISYWPKPVAPVCIHCDSQAVIGRAGSMMYNDYVKSKDNVSDPLTKGLSREGVERTSKGMGLRPRTSQHGASFISSMLANHFVLALDPEETPNSNLTYNGRFMKLRLDRVLQESYEADCLEEALASNPVDLEFEKPEKWTAPYPKYEYGW